MTKPKGVRKRPAPPLTSEDVAARASNLIFRDFDGIVAGLIVAAKSGNAPCARFLAEFSGLYPREAQAPAVTPDGFAAELLRRADEARDADGLPAFPPEEVVAGGREAPADVPQAS